jgi:hypothetical protein
MVLTRATGGAHGSEYSTPPMLAADPTKGRAEAYAKDLHLLFLPNNMHTLPQLMARNPIGDF